MSEPQVAIVTGVSSGIGQAIAVLLVEHGFQVFGTVRSAAHPLPGGVRPLHNGGVTERLPDDDIAQWLGSRPGWERLGDEIRKFFLNVSKEEQKRRFLSRLDEPEKNWKFSAADVQERRHWDDYQQNYEDMIRLTSSKRAPWIVVPADNKWFARLVVSSVIVHALKDMKLAYPKVSDEKRRELALARRELEGKVKPKKS